MNFLEGVKEALSCGIPLFEMGVNNWALTEAQAALVLDKFESLEIPVLGGDVYEMIGGEPESNYDNWYCERKTNEELGEFITRSIHYARQYIGNYKKPESREIFFVITCGASITSI